MFVLAGCSSGHPQNAPKVVIYDGSYLGYVEQPVGTADCGQVTYRGTTSGALLFGSGAARTLRFEGMGCTIDLDERGTRAWSASGRACRFEGAVTIRDLGVTAISFDEYGLDLDAETMNATGRMTRQSGAGPVSYCFEIQATLTEESAPAGGAAGAPLAHESRSTRRAGE
jgi:hypothetical protein